MRNVYKDIAQRTGGDIYIGVVGPVRSGKSTFINKFMETAVIPNIVGEYHQKKARDELPQSADGKTVMTAEPKFIPDEAVEVSFGDGVNIRMRMIDSVGYVIPGALGMTEDGEMRMVKTPWSEEQIPFEQAATEGTERVIREHSTVGMLVTCDGTFGEIPRENYVEAEEKAVGELKEIGKPFVLILNSKDPASAEAEELAVNLEKKYSCPVALVNCLDLDSNDINNIFEMLLYEFALTRINIHMPKWICAIPKGHMLNEEILRCIKEVSNSSMTLSDVRGFVDRLRTGLFEKLSIFSVDSGCSAEINSYDLSSGTVDIKVELPEKLYYKIICDLTGLSISSQSELISVLLSLADAKKELEKYEGAIASLENMGYGIVMPTISDLELCEPEVIKNAGAYGVKIKARAESIHMIKAHIETEINPIVGTQDQAEEIIQRLVGDFEDEPQKLWESNIFGKSLYELINDGLNSKVEHLSEGSREKLSETLSRIVNESSNGLICILL